MREPGEEPTPRCENCGVPYYGAPSAPNTPLYCPQCAVLKGRDPRYIIPEALDEAAQQQEIRSGDLVRWPLQSLHDLLGFLLPGTVTYGAAFPGNGKTAFVAQMIASWAEQGWRPWVMPTESRPRGLMTRLAAMRAGVDPDDALSFRLRERADNGDAVAQMDFDRLTRTYATMRAELETSAATLAIEPTPVLTPVTFKRSCEAAARAGSYIVICDHVDHVQATPGSGVGGYQCSEQVQHDALQFAQDYDLPLLLMSQLNSSRTAGDPLHAYRRPPLDWLWMKGVKDQVATTIFGLFRPIDPYCAPEILKGARDGTTETWRVGLPHTMGVAAMKQRHGGSQRDRVLHLEFKGGALRDLPSYDRTPHPVSTRPQGRLSV